jgi:protein-S-isoprenylcysteine O-methyltransferase Ste14
MPLVDLNQHGPAGSEGGMLKVLVGSGDRIGLFTLPFVAVASLLYVLHPDWFGVGGPPLAVKLVSACVLALGVVVWAWSVVLILAKVPKHELITNGPYAWVKHPLYTAVSLLVLPSAGLLLDTWLGVPVGIALYFGSRLYSPDEERALSRTFGGAWSDYERQVKIPWL